MSPMIGHLIKKLSSETKPLKAAAGRKRLTDAYSAEHDLFSTFGVVAFSIVLAGFARTFFLRFMFSSRSMPLYLYLHGLLFSTWFVLFFIQTRLVAAHRVDLHRRLGILSAGLAGFAVPLAVGVAIHAGKRVYEAQTKPFSMEAPPLALARDLSAKARISRRTFLNRLLDQVSVAFDYATPAASICHSA